MVSTPPTTPLSMRKIETRIFAKSEPIYIGPSSCHDPKVFKSIFTGVGLRIRLNCSQDEDFDIAVEKFSRALAVSGFKYEKAKSELMKSKNIDREAYLKEEKNRKLKQKNKNNGKVFWISRYDPRIPHPRELLSENYKILEGDPVARKIFERKNLVAGSKRGKNIQELISPTVQKQKSKAQKVGPNQPRGSFQCPNFKAGKKCELCSHVREGVEYVVSKHFNTKHAVRGHLVHQPRDKRFKDRWFIYQISDDHCGKTYVGSTVDMYGRWAKHKSDCNRGSTATGLSAHFAVGCPGDTGRDKSNLSVTLLDYMDVTEEEVQTAQHGGVGCICSLCKKLKNLEDNWIMKLGCFYHPAGLNKRDEIKNKVRSKY